MITLYDYELSADCYSARLLLDILALDYKTVAVDIYPGQEHRKSWFTRLSPLGELPVLDVSGIILADVSAILVYLGSQNDTASQWLPKEPAEMASTIAWVAFSRRLAASAGLARSIQSTFETGDLARAQSTAHLLLRHLDEHLWFAEERGESWLVAQEHPTLAELACFPHVALAEEGGVSRQDYPAVRRWMDRVRRIEGFRLMSGIFPAGQAHPVNSPTGHPSDRKRQWDNTTNITPR